MTDDRIWASPRGRIEVHRGDGEAGLRAWDGADAYLLEALDERFGDRAAGPILVVDDAFGALSTALASRAEVLAWGDSATAAAALGANLARNQLGPVPSTPLSGPPPEGARVVLVRLPRGLRRLEWLLARLSAVLIPGTPVLLGARSKDVQRSAVEAVEAAIGPASSTRARHRARLIVAVRDERSAPEPGGWTWEAGPGILIRGFPGVFGEKRMDAGTRLLAAEIGPWDAVDVVDLGCGAGPLGLLAGAANPTARVHFRDASHLAVASARRAWRGEEATFVAGDVLDGMPDRSVDVVLCNPPFHEGRVITRGVAHRMIEESARVLRPTGRLLLVGNRHLGYHQRLPRSFHDVRVARSDRRFVVFEAREPR
jgi:16S rRNA G1207 methylase RsmC